MNKVIKNDENSKTGDKYTFVYIHKQRFCTHTHTHTENKSITGVKYDENLFANHKDFDIFSLSRYVCRCVCMGANYVCPK